MLSFVFHSILGFSGVQNRSFQFFLGVKALPVASDCPNRTIEKSPIVLSQSPRAVRFQLIAHFAACVTRRGHHDMHMSRPWIGDPQSPLPVFAMRKDFGCDNLTVFAGQQNNIMFKPISQGT